jgi:hypothetical protein
LTQQTCQALHDLHAWMLNVSNPGVLQRISGSRGAADKQSTGTPS